MSHNDLRARAACHTASLGRRWQPLLDFAAICSDCNSSKMFFSNHNLQDTARFKKKMCNFDHHPRFGPNPLEETCATWPAQSKSVRELPEVTEALRPSKNLGQVKKRICFLSSI